MASARTVVLVLLALATDVSCEQWVRPSQVKHSTKASNSEDKPHSPAKAEVLYAAPPMQASCPSLPTTQKAALLTLALCAAWMLGFVVLRRTNFGVGAGPPSAGNGRMPILDNAKFVVMILVILQHTGVAFLYDDFRTDVFQFIQFHTRTFCFLSGIVARSPPNLRSLKSLLFSLVAPHIFWVTIIQTLGWATRGDILRGATTSEFMYDRMTELFTGAGLEWFLFSLIWWRVLGWMLMPLKATPRMCVAVGLAVVSGYPEETIITSIGHHILSYLPVFVLGQLFPLQEVLDRVPHGGASIGTGVFVFLGFWCIECGEAGRAFMAEMPMYDWVSMPSCGGVSDGLFWIRGAWRGMLEISKGIVFIVLMCPRTQCFITPYGQSSLYPYLLQGVLAPTELKPLQAVCFFFGQPPQWIAAIVAIANSIFLNIILGTAPVKYVFSVFLEPSWLEKLFAVQDEPAKPAPAKVESGKTLMSDDAKVTAPLVANLKLAYGAAA